MTTTWNIFDTEYQKADGLITLLRYGCTVTSEGIVDRKIGNLNLSGNPSSAGFIPYGSLTEETLVQWVKTSLGSTEVSAIESTLQDLVSSKVSQEQAQATSNGLPWRQ